MAEEGSGTGTSVGAISVDVEANLSQFEAAMKKFDTDVTKASGRQIKLQLNLAKDFTAKEKMVEVTAKWAAGTLTGLAEKLAARNYAVTITKLHVSQGALTALRSQLNSLFENYTANIDITAHIKGIDVTTGDSVSLNGNILSSASVASAASADAGARRSTGRARNKQAEPIPQETEVVSTPRARAPRKTTAQRAAETAAAAAASAEQERQLREQERLDNLARMKAETAAGRPRFSAAARERAAAMTQYARPDVLPEWVRLMNERTASGKRNTGFLPGNVATAMRARIGELADARGRKGRISDEETELKEFLEPYRDAWLAGQPTTTRKSKRKRAGGHEQLDEAPLYDVSGGMRGRVPLREDQPTSRSADDQALFDYVKSRKAMSYLRSVAPEFKPNPREQWPRALDRAREEGATPARMGEGVSWSRPLGASGASIEEVFDDIRLRESPAAAEDFLTKARASIKEKLGEKAYKRKHQLAHSLLNDVKTGRMTPEEREALDPVNVDDQDVADIMTLNQLGGLAKGETDQSSSSPTIGKRAQGSVRREGFATEAADDINAKREAAEAKAVTRWRDRATNPLNIIGGKADDAELTQLGKRQRRAVLSAGTRAANKASAAYGYRYVEPNLRSEEGREAGQRLFDQNLHGQAVGPSFGAAPDALEGFESGPMAGRQGPMPQPGMEMSGIGPTQTPEGRWHTLGSPESVRSGGFNRGMHKTKTGQWWWNKTATERTRRAKAEDVAEYQRIQAEHAAFAATQAGAIVGGATRPSEVDTRPSAAPASTPFEQGESAQWRLTPTGRAQRLVNGRWQFGSTSSYNAWASTNGAPTAGTRTEPSVESQIPQIPLAAGPEPRGRSLRAAENIEPIGQGGVSISGPIDVNVLNFQDLASMLRNTSIGEGQQSLQGTPEEVAKALGFASMDDFRAALTGNAPIPADDGGATGVGGKKQKRMRRNRYGGASIEMLELPNEGATTRKVAYSTGDPIEMEQAEQAKAVKEARKRDASFTADARAQKKQDEAEIRAAERADAAAKRQQEAQAKAEKKKQEDRDRADARAGGPTPTSTTASYFRRQGLEYAPVRDSRKPQERRDPAELAAERAQQASTRAEFPERAPSIAVGQLFARAVGFKTRYQQAQEELTLRRKGLDTSRAELAQEQESTDNARQNILTFNEANAEKLKSKTLSAEELVQQKDLAKTYVEHRSRLQQVTGEVAKQTDEVEKQTKQVEKSAGAFEKVASIGALFVGAKAFTVGLSLAGAGLSIVEKAGAKAVDRLLGYEATSNRVTSSLAEQTKALHGNADAVFGAAAMTAGLSEEAQKFVRNSTQMTASAKAGGLAQGETSELFKAGLGAGQSPRGLYSGYGGLFGGAFLGSEMGGGKGYAEQVIADLSLFRQQQMPTTRGVQNPVYGVQNPVTGVQDPIVGVQNSNQSIARPGEGTTPADIERMAKAQKAQVAYLEDTNKAYERNFTYLGKASEGLQLVSDAGPDAAKAMSDVAMQLTGDAKTAAENMAKNGLAIKDATGTVIETAAEFQSFWQNAAGGKSRPEASSVYQQQGWQLRAQLQSQQAAYRYQTDNKIPGNWGLQLGINPMAEVTGAGTPFSAMARGTSPAARSSAMGIANQAQTGRNAIQAQADAYLQSMVANAQFQLNAGGNATGAANLQTNLTNVLQLGIQIRDVTKQISFIGAAQQAKEYANSLRLAQRAKEDALGLAGRGGSELGGIQRQQYMLGRESTALSLAMSQRQINYQVAVAGFQAPGGTSEARAANIKEAKLEAAYAQKQLDIQKKQFALGGREFGITAARAVTDAMASIGLLQSGRDASLQIAAYTAQLENLQTEQQLEVAKLQEGLNAADNIFQTKLGMAATAAGTLGVSLDEATAALNKWMESNGFGPQTPRTEPLRNSQGLVGDPKEGGPTAAISESSSKAIAAANAAVKATNKQLGEVNKAQAGAARGMAAATASNAKSISTYVNTVIAYWTRLFAAITASSNAYSQGVSNGSGSNGGQRDPKENAAGFLGTVSGATQMIMGEAGNETVAILRNPRSVSATGSGGGGTSIVIQINNPSVRNDGDIPAIAREVEKVLNRKASLIGMRSI